MAYRSSSSNSGNSNVPSVAVPAGVAIGDIVLLALSADSASANPDDPGVPPTGFTNLHDLNLTNDGHSVCLWWKRLTGVDSGTYQFGSIGAVPDWVCQAVAFSGRHATNPPVSTSAVNNSANTSPVTITASSVTALAGDDMAVFSLPDVNTAGGGNGHSVPTNYTERQDVEGPGAGWCNLAIFTRDNVSAGATGTVATTFTLSGGNTGWAAFHVRIPAAAASGVNGEVTQTLGALTLAAAGTLPLSGVVANTLGALTLASAGSLAIAGVAASTLGALTLAAAGQGADLTGVTNVTLGSLTLASVGTVSLNGTLARTLGVLTLSSVGTLPLSGTLAQTLGVLTVSSAGSLPLSGTLARTLGALTLSSAGTVSINGATARTLGILTLASTGVLTNAITGVLTATLGALTVTSVGTVSLNGVVAATLGTLIAVSAGSISLSGVTSQALAPLTLASAGVLNLNGVLSRTLGDLTLASAGSLGSGLISGVVSATLGELILDGTGTLEVTGSLSQTLGVLTVVATNIEEPQQEFTFWMDTDIFMQHPNASVSIAGGPAVACHRDDYEEVVTDTENEGGVIARVIAVTIPATKDGGVKIGDTVVVSGVSMLVRTRRRIHEGIFTHLLLELP